MKTLLFKRHKFRVWSNRIIKILLCVLIVLLYMDGEHYVQCKCIFPDDIMDLPCFFSPIRIKNKQIIYKENKENKQFIPFIELEIPYLISVSLNDISILLVWSNFQAFKKRLFFLQHYKSWDCISLFHPSIHCKKGSRKVMC